MGKQPELTVEYWNLSDIKPYFKNAKTHAVGRIAASIKNFKMDQPIVVDGEGVIIKGHGRLKAAKRLRMKKLPVIVRTDLTPEEARLARIADNRSAEAPWDTKILKDELDDLNLPSIDLDFSSMGIDEGWFEELDIEVDLGDLHPPHVEPPKHDEGDLPTPPSIPKTQLGDIYLLGNHRVMCGDSTVKKDVTTLLNSNTVDMLLTDPPYNVDYSSKNEMLNKLDKGNRIQTPIINDKIKDFKLFCVAFLSNIPFSNYNTAYCFISGKEIHNLIIAYLDVGLYYSQNLTWLKNNHVLGRNDYKRKTESIIYGWKGKHKFYGDFSNDVFEFPKPQKSELHPTMKPTDLLCKILRDGSKEGDLVYDAFGRSGSTLIACEQTDRKAYLMELSPEYVDVIVERWENFTGKKAQLLTK